MATITIYASTGVAKIDLRMSNGATKTIYENDHYSWTRLDSNSWIKVEDVDALSSYSNPYTDNYGNNLNDGHTYYFSGGDQNVYVKATYKQPVVTYTISYNGNGADGGSTESQSGQTSYIARSCGFYKTGYSFSYWRTANGTRYNSGDIITPSSNMTLYAVWERIQTDFTLSYNGNGATGGSTSPQTGNYYYTVSECGFYKTGYQFHYWQTADGTGYYPGDVIVLDSNTTLYAVWGKPHVLKLISKGQHYATITLYPGEGIFLNAPFDTETERFEYWYEDLGSGEIRIFYEGDSVEYCDLDDETTFKAAWETIAWPIKYDANGGTGAPDDGLKEKDVAYTIPSTRPTRTGYSFAGWSDNIGTGKTWEPGDSYTNNSGVTFTAIWTPNTYTITYNANGGTGAPNAQTKTHNVDLTLSSTVPIRSGYDFVNWFDGTDYYSPGGTYTANSPASLYAQWRLKTYTISYNANGGTGEPSAGTKTHGVTYTIPSTIPTKEGNSFQHWVDDLENSYDPGESYYRNANTIFSAVWKLNEYDVTYYANGGSGAPEKQKKIYGQDLTLSTVKPTKANSVFLGWAKSSAATTAQYQPGDTYTENKTLSLWAVWTAKTKFYWHGSDPEDAKYFKVGERIDLAVTASAWNDLCDYINTVRSLAGLSTVAFAKVTAGQAIKANTFNIVRNAINQIVQKGYGKAAYVPDTVSTGTTITTVMFNGTKGLKNAINKCMDDL